MKTSATGMNRISVCDMAKMLDGREYGHEITAKEEQLAKDNDLVVVFGSSDDLAEFRGAVYDEAGCHNGGKILLYKDMVSTPDNEDNRGPQEPCIEIKAVWCSKTVDATWSYITSAPHAEFNILEGGNVYCQGIVVSINALLSDPPVRYVRYAYTRPSDWDGEHCPECGAAILRWDKFAICKKCDWVGETELSNKAIMIEFTITFDGESDTHTVVLKSEGD